MSAARRMFVGHANTIHDPALAVIEEDRVFAEALERHTQCKRSWEMTRFWYSARAIRGALAQLGMPPMDEGQLLFASTWSELKTTAQSCGISWPQAFEDPTAYPAPTMQYAQIALEPLAINQLRSLLGGLLSPGRGELQVRASARTAVSARTVMHHLAHAASAALTSPFRECTVVVADGYGEGTALSVYEFREDASLELVHQSEPGVSLGLPYMGITEACGFDADAGEEACTCRARPRTMATHWGPPSI